MINKSESITELAKALSAFQGELKPAKKDEVNPWCPHILLGEYKNNSQKHLTLDYICATIKL